MDRSNISKRFTASLHTHVRSIFDAHIKPKDLAHRIKDLGGKGVAITDHGVLSSIEDYRTVMAENGLKTIPGVELYVDGQILGRMHLVLLAVNDNGYHGICKIVTESNRTMHNGFPVISEGTLFQMVQEYRGDIIALSACVQGILGAAFLRNEKIDSQIAKIEEKMSALGANKPEDKSAAISEMDACYNNAILRRDYVKSVAEQKFKKRENAIKKLEKKGNDDDTLQKFKSELDTDKAAAIRAQRDVPAAVEAVAAAKKKLNALIKAQKQLDEYNTAYSTYEKKLADTKAKLYTAEQMYDNARETAIRYLGTFGNGNFYAELQYHDIPKEKPCFQQIAKLAKELSIPVVATNDVHILTNSEDDILKRQTLRSMRDSKKNEWLEPEVGDSELYLKDNYELADALGKILPDDIVLEAINNIDVIFDRCNVAFTTGKHYPKFSQTEDANKILEKEIQEGIKRIFPDGMDKEHQDRLSYELPVIESMGYADYHLIVKDYLEYGRLLGYVDESMIDTAPLTIPELEDFIRTHGWKNPGFRIGPGRGSAVGSLVCYLLGITSLDPIKYGLLFERFLNPERVSMPDIDSDISAATRQKLVQYVQNKYGQMAICGIMTVNAQAPKGCLRIAAKYYGIRKNGEPMTSLGGSIAKMVSSEPNMSFSTKVALNGEPSCEPSVKTVSLLEYLMDAYKKNDDAINIIKWASVMEGSFTAYSAHAAGVVISDNGDVSDYIPLRWNSTMQLFNTQCTATQVEDNGLLKFDFLGLQTLDIITEASKMIEHNYGVIIDPLKLDLNDPAVYNIFSSGRTNSIFQFESSGMKTMLKKFAPDCFDDLIILVSMFRPGPLQYLDDVINVKTGKKPMEFMCDALKPILGKTYGAIVYQEQVMQICQSLAGFTLGHADQVRRYMSKKKADKLGHERDNFVTGCASNGISVDISNKLFDQMMDFAAYAFNKSHAAAYAYIAYITAWFKCHYPAEFFAAALNWATKKKLPGLMYEAKICGVTVSVPAINSSDKNFSVSDGKVLFGLSMVTGVKNNATSIIEERRKNGTFNSLKDFMLRVKTDKTVRNNLIAAGAFDSFAKNRAAMQAMAEDISEPLSKLKKKEDTERELMAESPLKRSASESKKLDNCRTAIQNLSDEIDRIAIRNVEEDQSARMASEKELIGAYVTAHPMDFYPAPEDVNASVIANAQEGSDTLYGVITDLKIKNRKRDGAKMAFFTLEDRSGTMEVCVFSKAFSVCGSSLADGAVVLLDGTVNYKESDYTDENGLEETEKQMQFLTEKVRLVLPKKKSLCMHVSSMTAFHLDCEPYFRKEYEQKNGYKLIVYDESLGEMREMNYCVSDRVRQLNNVEEICL